MKKLTLAFALAAAALSTPGFATGHTPTVHVAYSDLRLADANAREVLDRRISTAIDSACGVDVQTRALAEQRASRRCVQAKQAEVAPLRAAALASHGVPLRVASTGR